MQTTNVIYRAILAGKHYVEYKVEIAGQTYTQSDIYGTPEIASAFFEKFSIGNASSSTLKITLKPKSIIPQMALVEVYFRLVGNNINSSWYPKGKFYIDTRKLNHDGYLSLECFDAMLKSEYTFMESGTWTSTTALATLNMIASDMGVLVDADTTTLLTNDSKTVPNVPIIGEDGTTGREMLEAIAAMYGGDFIIDELGKLKLVQLVTPVTTIDIGDHAAGLDDAPAFDAIDRVILYANESKDSGYRSPEATFDSLTGRILEAFCPWTSQELADDLLDIVDGYVYQPFVATGANIDPAMQLGDGIEVGSVTSVIYAATLKLDARCAADLSAPYEEEINHEYPYRSPAQRVVDDAVTKEELATPGQTAINGANITTGTITLGGNGNGRGELVILNENNAEFGRWNNERLLVYDDSTSAYREKARLAILREGASPSSQYGAFLGVTQTGGTGDPQPFLYLNGTIDSGNLNNYVEIRPEQITFHHDNSGGVNADVITLGARCISYGATVTPIGTNTFSVNTVTSYKWGKVLQLTVKFDTSSFSAGTVFQGSTNAIPISDVMGCSFIGTTPIFGWINTNGIIEIRACGNYSYSGEVTMSWTMLQRNNG